MKPDRRKNLIYKNYLEQNFISDGGLKSKIIIKIKIQKENIQIEIRKKKMVILFMKIINLKSKVLIFKKMKLRKIKMKKVI